MTGKLYVVATPIGNLGDITKRAVEVLGGVDHIAAEDTRETRGLLRKLDISCNKTFFTNNGYNENTAKDKIVDVLLSGADVALVSDAGMPGISDPGAILVEAAASAGIDVVGVCGASAVITAVAVSGFVKSNSDFAFFGFLPRKRNEITEKLRYAAKTGVSAAVFYEAPLRIIETLEITAQTLPDARVCLCNDLTKLYERIYRGSPGEVLSELKANPNAEKGEYAMVLELSGVKTEEEKAMAASCPECALVEYMLKNACDAKTAVNEAPLHCEYSKNQLKAASFRLSELFNKKNK